MFKLKKLNDYSYSYNNTFNDIILKASYSNSNGFSYETKMRKKEIFKFFGILIDKYNKL